MKLYNRLVMSLARRPGNVVLRSELRDMASASQLSHVLKKLTEDGKIIRIEAGVYAKAKVDDEGSALPVAPIEKLREELTQKPGYRTSRNASGSYEAFKISNPNVVSLKRRASNPQRISMPSDLQALPKRNVSAFVHQFANANRVNYRRTALDDFSEAVTRASGDDVKLDTTGKLLVTLKRRALINGRQMSRLMTNHMNETKKRV